MARLVQPGVEKLLGQPLVIENRPGAGGLIAIDAVAKSPPDGYVIGLGGDGRARQQSRLSGESAYEPRKDIVPVTGLAGSPFILAAAPSFQGKSLRDVIALAKAPGDKLTIGHGGNGTLMHLTAELFNQMAGIKARARALPRHGAGGDRPDRQPCGVRHHRSAVRHVGDRGAARSRRSRSPRPSASPRLPDVPTFAESGLPGFESNGSFGIVAPAGTPADVIAKLNAAFVTVLNDPDDRQAHPRARRRADADDAGRVRHLRQDARPRSGSRSRARPLNQTDARTSLVGVDLTSRRRLGANRLQNYSVNQTFRPPGSGTARAP